MSFPVYVTQHVGTICLHIADIWHPFPFLFPNMCSSTSLAIRGLADKVVWRSIAYVFCCLHTDPFLTLPLGWFPRNHPPAVHQCHACLAKFIDMQQDLPFQKYHKKKKKIPCVMTACSQQFHLDACCFSICRSTFVYYALWIGHFDKIKCHNIFIVYLLPQNHYISGGNYEFLKIILSSEDT